MCDRSAPLLGAWTSGIDLGAMLHEAQLPTYMRLAGIATGLLINFNVTVLKDGIKRFKL